LDLYGIVNLIFFSPEDLNIIKNGPSGRRRFMDMELCQLNKVYANNLVSYNKTLDQRNKLLKDISFNPSLKDTLDIWDIQITKYGKEIISTRKEFIEKLNYIISPVHSKLTGGKEELTISYEPSTTFENYEKELSNYRDKDIRMKVTEIGPHRDDVIFLINGIDIRKYGSQGQQRTTALSLKLAEIELVKEIASKTGLDNKDVMVIGGGNSAFEESLYLAKLCKHVYLIHRTDQYRASSIIVDKVKETANITLIPHTVVKEFKGNATLEKVVIDTLGKESELNVDGTFIYIGYLPATSFLKDFDVLNELGFVVVDDNYQTIVEGLYAVGDCINHPVKQIATAVGDASAAANNIIKKL
jgi:NADPH-dependent 2,4-dienoyl-CoA reductase/sulfur reductase-like enzyme